MHTANPIMIQNIRDCHYQYARYYLKYGMILHYYNVCVSYFLSTHDSSKITVKFMGYFLRCFDIVNLYKYFNKSR